MDFLKKLLPISFKATDKDNFIKALIIYIILDIVGGVVIGILSKIPLIGFVFSLLGSLVGIYAIGGIVVAILVFVKVIKD